MSPIDRVGHVNITGLDIQHVRESLDAERSNSMTLQSRVQELQRAAVESSAQMEQQHKTISLLVTEKASLTESVERLEDAESRP